MSSALRAIGPPEPPPDDPLDHIDEYIGRMSPEQLAHLDESFGVQPPEIDTTREVAPQAGIGEQIVSSLAGAGSGPQARARTFGEGLVQGGIQGVGAAGTRTQASRAKLEAGIALRQADRDKNNARATAEYRAARGKARSTVAGALLQDSLAGSRATRTEAAKAAAALAGEGRDNAEWNRRNKITAGQHANDTNKKVAAIKPPTEFQGRIQFFRARAEEAANNATANGLEGRVLNKAWSLQAPVATQRDPDVREYWRAMESFGLALNRLESGAAIAPTEFARVKQLYFVAPGDGPADVAAKVKARNTIISELGKLQAPGAQQDVSPSGAALLWEPD